MRRYFWFMLVVSLLVGVVANAPPDPLNAQPGKPPVKEEEEDPKPPVKPPIKKPMEEEEDEDNPNKPKPRPPLPSEGPFNLAEEADKQKDLPDKLKETLRELAIPFDLVVTKDAMKKTRWKAEPVSKRFDPAGSAGIRGFVGVDMENKDRKFGPIDLQRAQIESVEHYEDRILKEAGALVAKGGGQGLSRYRSLRLAEMLFDRAHRFITDEKKREGDGWKEIATKLDEDLRKVRIAEVRALVEEKDKDLDLAEVMAERLYERHKKAHRELLDAIEAIFLARAEIALAASRFHKVHEHIKSLDKFPGAEDLPNAEMFRKRLQEQAAKLFELGQTKAKDAQPLMEKEASRGKGRELQGEALKHLKDSERAWPKLPGVREARIAMERSYPVLRVGVRQLPTQLSPTTAESDVDRIASRLVFDRLLQLRAGPSARDGYICKLGFEPKAKQGGWEIVLPAELKWSDGKPVTTDDLRRSLDVVGDSRSHTFNPLASGADGLLQAQIDDRQKMRLSLKQGFVDPPALLTFDVLPAHLLPADVSPRNFAFGKKPVGTGPYVFAGANEIEATFVANPHYRRPHAPNGPAIQEISFVRYSNFDEAKQALQGGELHMLLDLRTAELAALKDVAGFRSVTSTETEQKPPHLANPRIYFLAPNHRRTELQNEDLRQAIATAINRDEVIRNVFRGTDKSRHHQVLNGPFPIGSWAYHPDYVPEKKKLYNPDESKKHLEEAKKRITLRPMTLLCASDDADGVKACERIRDALKTAGITIEVIKHPRHRVAAELAKETPDFDFVYTCFDFENETLSLWPLFDPNAIGKEGRNFMGYSGDAELEALMRGLLQRRDFSTIQSRARELHEMMMKKMVFIPLWQLDRHLVVANNLKPAPGQTRLHPLGLFEDVEQWQLTPKE